MHSAMFIFVFGLVSLYFFATDVMAVKCYVCNNCNDPFQKSEGKETTCATGCQKTKIEAEGKQYVMRGCTTEKGNKCDKGDLQVLTIKGKGTACVCDKDMCNGATTTNVKISIFLAAAGLIIMAKHAIC